MKLTGGIVAIAFVLLVTVIVSAQQNAFPNELKGYEFFGKGRLSEVRFVTTGKPEIRALLGNKCEKVCDYNADWEMRFEYFEDIWSTQSRNATGEITRSTLDPKYLGKLRVISLIPKKEIILGDKDFAPSFSRIIITSNSDRLPGKSRMTVNDAFSDEFGLTYELYNRTNYDDFRDTPSRVKGQLVMVRYELTNAAQKALFVLQPSK
jgi:hypothetical protein